ncbi:MAG TPA: hypothetical protein VIM77_05500, partial [Mucilaginibacter sp.]
VLVYDFPILPNVGDLIEVLEDDTMFIIQARSFKPLNDNELIPVMLHGVFENSEEMGLHTFDDFIIKIRDQREGIRRNREGMIES